MDRAARVWFVDSHTAGEPTRLVIEGGPDLGGGSMADRLAVFRQRHDRFRSAVANEPRGSDATVGALLCEPADPANCAGVIFFNNVGFLGMCGHGTIGVVASLAWLGRLRPGTHRIETAVGTVSAELHSSGEVTVANVPSYRYRAGVQLEVPQVGRVVGDVAWGGNWFFLADLGALRPGLSIELANRDALTALARAIRSALSASAVTGAGGAQIDHVELFGPPLGAAADARNFVLCPGDAYDRSPCGTGTSAKLACLYADGKLGPGQTWRQQGVLGSVFEGSIEVRDGKVYPFIRGSAWVNMEGTLRFDDRDPFAWGIR
jgi:4-hydroxyproline epimerase